MKALTALGLMIVISVLASALVGTAYNAAHNCGLTIYSAGGRYEYRLIEETRYGTGYFVRTFTSKENL